MLNKGNWHLLNNYSHMVKQPIALDNYTNNMANGLNSQNSLINIKQSIPSLQSRIKNNNNMNIKGQFDEINFLNMINNISLEPSNQKRNIISTLSQGQSLSGMNSPLGMLQSLNNQNQNFLSGAYNSRDNIDQNLLLKKLILLKLLNNMENKQINDYNNEINNIKAQSILSQLISK